MPRTTNKVQWRYNLDHGKFRTDVGIHIVHQWEYADEAERLADSGFDSKDLYKLALQLDTKTLYLLSGISPATWVALGSNQQSQSQQSNSFTATAQTTDGTSNVELLLSGSPSRCIISNDTTWLFTISLVARRMDAKNESVAYKFEGCIDNNTNTVALVGSVEKTVLAEDSVWGADVVADNTNKSLKIQVTGEAGKTIN